MGFQNGNGGRCCITRGFRRLCYAKTLISCCQDKELSARGIHSIAPSDSCRGRSNSVSECLWARSIVEAGRHRIGGKKIQNGSSPYFPYILLRKFHSLLPIWQEGIHKIWIHRANAQGIFLMDTVAANEGRRVLLL